MYLTVIPFSVLYLDARSLGIAGTKYLLAETWWFQGAEVQDKSRCAY